jgi:4-hydroxy-tetrahydrodipicolinate reductase
LNKKFKLINFHSKNNDEDLKNNIKESDIIIDFSRPIASIAAIKIAIALKKKMIIGTTGFSAKQESFIKKTSKKIAIFKSGNMSLGINLIEYISKILSKKIPNNYQISVYDNHHKKKMDYPSGTALMLANAIASGKSKKLKPILRGNFKNSDRKNDRDNNWEEQTDGNAKSKILSVISKR